MANEKKVTMKDIAEELDVSIVTVSKALAGKEGVGDSLREKILRKSKELGYVIKRSTVSERGGSRSIAIIIAERFIGDDSFYAKIYQSMLMELTARGLIGIMEIVRYADEDKGVMPNVLSMQEIEQVIVIGEMDRFFLSQLEKTGKKIVLFDFENEDFDIDSVVGDNINGGYLLTRYLIKNGYNKVGFIGNFKSTRSILDRYLGYRKYLIANDMEFENDWVISDRDEFGVDIPIMLPINMPEAFVCSCDVTAYRAIEALKKNGYSVPEDIAVVGYDDYANNMIPGVELTTYRVNTADMITQCVNVVEQKCTDPDYRHGTSISYGKLIERKTTLKKGQK